MLCTVWVPNAFVAVRVYVTVKKIFICSVLLPTDARFPELYPLLPVITTVGVGLPLIFHVPTILLALVWESGLTLNVPLGADPSPGINMSPVPVVKPLLLSLVSHACSR